VKRARFLADLLDAFIRRKEEDRRSVATSDDRLKILIPELGDEITPNWPKTKKPKIGADTGNGMILPGPRHFRRLLKTYVASGYQVQSLVEKRGGGKTRKRCTAEEEAIRFEFASKYAHPSRPSMAKVYRALVAALMVINAQRNSDGLPPMRVPKRKAFENLIHSLDPFHVNMQRHGAEKAMQHSRITGRGVDVERPGERVEMDEWEVDLFVLLTWLRIADTLTPEERMAVDRSRVWITVAIDAATRCILAMYFTNKAPSEESSMAALEMILVDKTEIATAAGAQTRWFQFCRPEALYTDRGAAFTASAFRAALADMHIAHKFPQKGEPRLRPFIESFFRTCTGFLDWYEGRTFSNYIQKGEYDSAANAKVSADQLNRDFVRAIVDDYHNRPQQGMAGETPYNAWLRLTKQYGYEPVPSPRIRREIFGIPVDRVVDDKGVLILGLHYNCEELQKARVHQGLKSVEVRFGRHDMSEVSVKIPDVGWLSVKNRFGLPRGVSIWEWVGAVKTLSKIHADNAKINLPIMMEAVNELRKSGEAASARGELGTGALNSRRVHQLEKLFLNFRIDEARQQIEKQDLAPIAKPTSALIRGNDLLGSPKAYFRVQPPVEAPKASEQPTSSQFGSAGSLKFEKP
jgi:putative transposase